MYLIKKGSAKKVKFRIKTPNYTIAIVKKAICKNKENLKMAEAQTVIQAAPPENLR